MGAPPELYLQFILSLFSIVMTALVGYWVKRISDREAERRRDAVRHANELRVAELKRKEEFEAIKDGLIALLRDKIIQSDVSFTESGVVKISQKDNIQMLYESYHRLGGNGIVTQSYKHIMGMPLTEGDAGR